MVPDGVSSFYLTQGVLGVTVIIESVVIVFLFIQYRSSQNDRVKDLQQTRDSVIQPLKALQQTMDSVFEMVKIRKD